MIKNLRIPYMGSKRKLAPKILDYILEEHPNTKYFYDVFGGGGAISFQALQYPQIEKVFYNDLDTAVCELLKKIQKDGVTPEFYNWVSREEFNELKNGKDWKAGLVKTCWSFGNNYRSYLFGKNIEQVKKEAHEYLFANGYDYTKETRTRLVKQFKNEKLIKKRFELESLERLQQLESLERLQQLGRLQQLEPLPTLSVSNLSYEQVQIITPTRETIIYLDPPYINTVKYNESLNHNELYSWIDTLVELGYKVYLSSYESPLTEVMSWEHGSTLSATANNKTTEKLFTTLLLRKPNCL